MGIARLRAISLVFLMPASSLAQDYPNKPLRLLAPFPAGGGVDIVARLLSAKLTERWGQQVVVDNRAGASGIIGTEIAARAPADGYTLVMGNVATLAVNAHLFRELPYDPVKDFAPVALVATVPELLVIHPAIPAANVKELIALARARPGQLNFGSAGSGSPPHLAAELFKSMAGVNMVHIPYKGSAPGLADLAGGQISMYFSNIMSALPLARAGKLRALGVTTAKRAAVAPDIPTIAEAGLPGYEEHNWYGLLAPAKTPAAIVAKLNAAVLDALGQPDVRERLAAQGAQVMGGSPGEFAAFVAAESRKYGEIVRRAGIRAE